MNKALTGLNILDFGQIVAGGHLSAMLADLGANVVKVEALTGDPLRTSGPLQFGESSYFSQENRGKKSIALNLKAPEAVEIVKKLLPHFDVVIENFRPGTMAKFGLTYEDCRQINPAIIYLSISGFGQNNSRTMEPAYDIILQAESGLARQTGYDAPARIPASLADYAAALNGAVALLAALRYRDQSGVGQYIDLAMYDTLLAMTDNSFSIWQKMAAAGASANDEAAQKAAGLISCGSSHPGTAPHGFYPTSDGYIAHMSLSEKMWQDLCGLIERPDLAADSTLDNPSKRRAAHERIDRAISEWTSRQTTARVIEMFRAARLPVAKVRTIAEAAGDKHNEERGIFCKLKQGDGTVKVPDFPAKLSETPAAPGAKAPALGEHTDEILAQYLALTPAEIKSLKERKIIG